MNNDSSYNRKVGGISKETFDALSDVDKIDYLDESPHCYIGTAEEPDMSWPQEDCCRVYELPNFIGRYFDFCLRAGESSTRYNFFRLYEEHTWEDEISSYKAGAGVKCDVYSRNIKEDTCSIINT